MLNKTLMLDRFVFSFPLFINNCFTEDFPVAHYAQPGWGGVLTIWGGAAEGSFWSHELLWVGGRIRKRLNVKTLQASCDKLAFYAVDMQ